MKEMYSWLRANLGNRSLGALTTQDSKALEAADRIAELLCYVSTDGVYRAFGEVVTLMQDTTRYLAFHLIARAGNWEDRWRVWERAGLNPEDIINKPMCKNEPDARKAAKA